MKAFGEVTKGLYVAPWDAQGARTDGIIFGVVQENGNPLSRASVACYFRANMQLIGRALTNSLGEFEFRGLDPTAPANPDDGKYFVVALDPNGGIRYNALIFDRVVPS